MDYTDQLVLTGALNDIGEALTENVPDSYRMGVELMLGIKPCKWFQWDINATWSKNCIQDFVESLPGYHYNETAVLLPSRLFRSSIKTLTSLSHLTFYLITVSHSIIRDSKRLCNRSS